MEQHNSETTVFKPRYSIGHWVQLFTPVAILLPQIIIRWFGRMDQDYWLAASPAVSLAYGLLAMLWVLEILIFLAGGHIKSIRVDNGWIELLRPLGRSIRSEVSQSSWKNHKLRLGRHTYSTQQIGNSGDLMRLLPPEVFQQKDRPKDRWWETDAFIVSVVILTSATMLALMMLSINGLLDLNPWVLYGLLALSVCALLGFLIKRLV